MAADGVVRIVADRRALSGSATHAQPCVGPSGVGGVGRPRRIMGRNVWETG
jgi:hypothetical protein